MADYNPSDPAIYGPVDGQFVTLSQWTAYMQQTYAAQQLAGSQAFNQEVQDTGIPATNPYIVPPPAAPTPPATTGGSGSTGTLGAKELAYLGGSDYCDMYPDDPLCSLWSGGTVIVGGEGGTTIEEPVIINEGLSAFDVNTAIDNGLSAVWSAVVSSVDAIIAVAIATIMGALTEIGNALKAAYAVLSRMAGFILQELETLVRDIVAGILGVLKDIRDLFRHLVDDVLKPLVGALGSLRQRLLDIYQRVIRPLLIWMQDIQRVLRVLALFHVRFAQQLDSAISDLERRITQPLLLLIGYTNQLGNWMNLLVTANYLLQKPVWIATLRAYMGSTVNAQINAINQPPNAADLQALQQAATVKTAAQAYSDFDQFAATNTGDGAAVIAQYGDMFDQTLQQTF